MKSYPHFMRELGWRRSAACFFTSSALCFVAAVLGAISWGEWREWFLKVIPDMISVHVLGLCLALMAVMLFGHMFCPKHLRIRMFLSKGVFWSGRLFLDLGAALLGVLIGVFPVMWFVDEATGWSQLELAFLLLPTLGVLTWIMHLVWLEEGQPLL